MALYIVPKEGVLEVSVFAFLAKQFKIIWETL